jgi:N-formylmaleamate deformylase
MDNRLMKRKKLLLFLLCLPSFILSKQPLFGLGHVSAKSHASPVYSFGVRVTGKGKPMLLIPGMKGSADTYNEIVAHYKTLYKCYVITLAGFADQPAGTSTEYPLRKQRDEIIQFIEDKHLDKPVLVGFSFGGSLALWIASTRPDLIGPLIELDGTPFDAAIENPNVSVDSVKKKAEKSHNKILSRDAAYWRRLDSTRRTPAYRREGFVELQNLESDSLRINQILDWDDLSDYKTSFLMGTEMDGLDLRDSVAKVKSPILVLGSWKGWDNVKTKEEAEKRYAAQYARAKEVTILFSANGKHFLMYEDFDWMISKMDAFLLKT